MEGPCIFMIVETMNGAELTLALARNSAEGWEVCGYGRGTLGGYSVLMQRPAPVPPEVDEEE